MTATVLLDDDDGHASAGHPERPARLDAVRQVLGADPALGALPRLDAPPAPREALERVHLPAYLDAVETFCETGGGRLDVDTYATPASWDVARRACGAALAAVDAVCTGEAEGVFALARPPGHHARPAQALGFCLLASAAVAARRAQAVHGAERVLIVDVDAHHGNGTQEAFYDDPSVLFFSSHQADIFPGTGQVEQTGAGAGEGATVNVPLPARAGDGLVALYRQLLPPLAERFRPDLVLVSAGYDAHRLDPLAGLALSVTGLADLVGAVQEVADQWTGGRLALVLEGGYHVETLAAGVTATLRRLLDPTAAVEDPFGPTRAREPDLTPVLEAVRQVHGL